jgi:hypothetical protein
MYFRRIIRRTCTQDEDVIVLWTFTVEKDGYSGLWMENGPDTGISTISTIKGEGVRWQPGVDMG